MEAAAPSDGYGRVDQGTTSWAAGASTSDPAVHLRREVVARSVAKRSQLPRHSGSPATGATRHLPGYYLAARVRPSA